jgi:hypothetical protein
MADMEISKEMPYAITGAPEGLMTASKETPYGVSGPPVLMAIAKEVMYAVSGRRPRGGAVGPQIY